MFELLTFITIMFSYFVLLNRFMSCSKKIDEGIKDMEIQITNLEVENTKIENEIKIISQSFKQKI